MKSRIVVTIAIMLALVLVAQAARAGIGETLEWNSIVETGDEAPGMVASLMVLPDGSGPSFAEAYLPGGVRVDRTVTIYLRDYVDQPVIGYPREDLWLATADEGVVSCQSWGLWMDADSDGEGMVRWAEPPMAGGYSSEACLVYENGSPWVATVIPVSFNSPDINGDLQVNISDAGFFVTDLFGAYAYRSDFNNDQTVNISDAGFMAQGLGASCPQ